MASIQSRFAHRLFNCRAPRRYGLFRAWFTSKAASSLVYPLASKVVSRVAGDASSIRFSAIQRRQPSSTRRSALGLTTPTAAYAGASFVPW